MSKKSFLEKILRLESEKETHYSVMTRDLYNKVLADVEEAKSDVKKKPLHYSQLKELSVLEIC